VIQSRQHNAFTMLELIFVIVVMGILAKFGVELLAQAYQSFIFSKVNNKLQVDSGYTLEFISKRLEHRIKNSVIYRDLGLGNHTVNFRSLNSGTSNNATILEWIGSDIDGYNQKLWSGVADLNITQTTTTSIASIDTNTTAINALIQALANNTSDINDSAIYFVGSYAANNQWGWDTNTTKFDTLSNVDIYPIKSDANITKFIPTNSAGVTTPLLGVEATEYYKLAWTAYAIALEDFNGTTNTGTLYMYDNYQPWKGEWYGQAGINVRKTRLMNNVSSFRFRNAGSFIKVQICTKDSLIQNEEYAICKEKTIF
jgi:prepilin-type N-terminal cleavage/methylation domain-containing protein